MKTVILCGGKGTRAYPYTVDAPKPLLEVGDRPLLRHVMDIYARQGFRAFVLAAGYRSDLVDDFATTLPEDWEVTVVDTGDETNTGGRIWRCREQTGRQFFVNYSDGLANIDLRRLLAFHSTHPGSATLTRVTLPSPYGTIECDSAGRVRLFREKPRLEKYWINAGFFVFDQQVWELWDGEDLEREVLPHLATQGELFVYLHSGFWQSADTFKDVEELAALWRRGAPWL